jgi:CheY-like chemotaxis protein
LNKEIQVYVLTSSVRPTDQQAASRYSFVNEFISKPLEPADVERIVADQYAN